jgi:hypothetical protein
MPTQKKKIFPTYGDRQPALFFTSRRLAPQNRFFTKRIIVKILTRQEENKKILGKSSRILLS